MTKTFFAAVCALCLFGTLAQAQSSQGKGGAAVTGDTADPAKGIGAPSAATTDVPSASTSAVVTRDATVNSTTTNPTNPATGAPVPNAAISRPPGDAAAPAGR